MKPTCSLLPVRRGDLPFVSELGNGDEVDNPFMWFGWYDPERFHRRWEESGLLGEDLGMLLIHAEKDRVGFVSWVRQVTTRVPLSFCYDLGIAVAPAFRSQGYGTQAHQLLARYLFEHTTCNRVQARTETTNLAEQRTLEKAGFLREGTIRGLTWRAGQWRDHVIYSILRTDLITPPKP
ncbi:GNAT family N-acetyltransferase [Nonomuraea sp. MG754425]|uniref:GNAT family N-acetyltransferase n=1 Tax=Nonomuraea sp. MG754425 TaxID=2570319 RepID=UPI002351B3F3|nr:GNAT family protein [Nonomuraea sp. MG754425]MCF6474750.1 GNAT family N-acetyltransferase [Nonomuraea sp. MG754425]